MNGKEDRKEWMSTFLKSEVENGRYFYYDYNIMIKGNNMRTTFFSSI